MIRILSLDDESEMLDLMRFILESVGFLKSDGFEYLTTTDEQEVLSILRDQSIDLFTQDFARPGPGGCEFLRRLKSEEALKSIPVLGITAGSRDMRSEQLSQVGLDLDRDLAGFVHKPFGPAELIDAIETALREQGKPVPSGVEEFRAHAQRPSKA